MQASFFNDVSVIGHLVSWGGGGEDTRAGEEVVVFEDEWKRQVGVLEREAVLLLSGVVKGGDVVMRWESESNLI